MDEIRAKMIWSFLLPRVKATQRMKIAIQMKAELITNFTSRPSPLALIN